MVLNMGTDHYSREELAEVFGTFVNNARKGAVVARSVYDAILPFVEFPEKITIFEDGDLQQGLYLSSYEVEDVAIANQQNFSSNLGEESIFKAYGMFHDEAVRRRELHVTFSDEYELVMPVWGRHNALPAIALPYRSGLFWSPQVAFLSPNCNAFWKEAKVFKPPWVTTALAVTVPGVTILPLNSFIPYLPPFVIFFKISASV